MSGELNLDGNRYVKVDTPVDLHDAVNMGYVNTLLAHKKLIARI